MNPGFKFLISKMGNITNLKFQSSLLGEEKYLYTLQISTVPYLGT